WTEPKEKFKSWKQCLRERSKNGTLFVARLYYFDSEDSKKALEAEMNEEVKCGILVRYIISTNQGAPPPDLSLLWTGDKLNWIQHRVEVDDPVDFVTEHKRKFLCGVHFSAFAGFDLTDMTISPDHSPDARSLQSAFTRWWGQGA